MQTGQNMVICKPKYLTLNKKIVSKKKKFLFCNFGVLLHTKMLSPFSLRRWRALSKFKAHIETGGQTIIRNILSSTVMIVKEKRVLFEKSYHNSTPWVPFFMSVGHAVFVKQGDNISGSVCRSVFPLISNSYGGRRNWE